MKLRCPGPVGWQREILQRNLSWRLPRTCQLCQTHRKDQTTRVLNRAKTSARATALQLKSNTANQKLTAADIPSIVQSIYQSLSTKDRCISGTAITNNTASTTGTANSSDAASNNATAKDNPSAATTPTANSSHLSAFPPSLDHRLASPPLFPLMWWTCHPEILISCFYICCAATSVVPFAHYFTLPPMNYPVLSLRSCCFVQLSNVCVSPYLFVHLRGLLARILLY